MQFALGFSATLFRLMLDGAPLFLGLGVIIAALAIAIGRREGWSIGDSRYFGFITAATVGYGDMTPTHGRGKFLAVLLAMIALAVEAADTAYDQVAAAPAT